jgi:anti-sigma-K factor RskA
MSTDVHTLSGAYALDALSPEEAAEFRRHLDGCQACRDEVRELQSAAARMGAAQASAPPPDLKARILAAADRTPQQPPAGVVTSIQKPAPRRWVAWVGAAAAAIVLITGGAVGIGMLSEEDGTNLAEGVVRVFEAEDARTATVETENGGKLTVGVSPARNEMAVDTSGLPELEEGQVYQLWAVQGEEMVSAAVLADPESGAAMGMPAKQTQVALTVEPEGGSDQPTSAPIVQVDPHEV